MRFSYSSIISFATGVSLGALLVASSIPFGGASRFGDVPDGAYFTDAVNDLADLGLIKGYDNGNFGPNDPVTRAQVAVLMKRLRDDILGGGNVATSSRSSSTTSSSTSSSSVSSVEKTEEGQVRFTIANYSIDEDEGTATISIIRTGGNKGVVTVSYTAKAGTATEGTDFTVAEGKITFADGETSRSFTVQVLDDSEDEKNETINITLSDPTDGLTLGTPSTATLTINDNDGTSGDNGGASDAAVQLAFSAEAYSIAEDGGDLVVTVKREGNTDTAIKVDYGTVDGTAKAAIDYNEATGTLDFPAGTDTQSFTVTMRDNSSKGGNKKFTIKLSNQTGGAAVKKNTAEVTIVDTELLDYGSGSLRFAENEYTASEGTTVHIAVERIYGAKGKVSVKYETKSGSASAGADFTTTNGTLVFEDGESVKTFPVVILKDDELDSNESINLTITSVDGSQLTSPETAIITIQ